MSHGFSRFGPPSARDRFHQQARPAGTLAMILPTIFATLFMFTVVVTLNKAGNMSRGGKIVRLLNVDDVFPTQLDVEQNRKKDFWELTPPPPSPEAVIGGQEQLLIPALVEQSSATVKSSLALPQPNPGWEYRDFGIDDSKSTTPPQRQLPLEYGALEFDGPMPDTMPKSQPVPGTTSVPTAEIPSPTVAPDTSLPVATPTP